MSWLAVRCCCTPNKIFGFLKYDGSDRKADGGTIYIRVLNKTGGAERVALRDMHRRRRGPQIEVELAVYSEERPIEFWRNIAGFIEASPDQQPDDDIDLACARENPLTITSPSA